jgi:hypothetical protein
MPAASAVYTVRISKQPRCDCPDAAKGHVCKHILFVYLRVLKLSASNPIVWQKALLTHEVRGAQRSLQQQARVRRLTGCGAPCACAAPAAGSARCRAPRRVVLSHHAQVEGVLSGAHSQGVAHLQGVLADVDVRSAYEQATGERAAAPAGAAAAAAGSGGVARKPVEGDCPICFSELKVRASGCAYVCVCGLEAVSGCCSSSRVKCAVARPRDDLHH